MLKWSNCFSCALWSALGQFLHQMCSRWKNRYAACMSKFSTVYLCSIIRRMACVMPKHWQAAASISIGALWLCKENFPSTLGLQRLAQGHQELHSSGFIFFSNTSVILHCNIYKWQKMPSHTVIVMASCHRYKPRLCSAWRCHIPAYRRTAPSTCAENMRISVPLVTP